MAVVPTDFSFDGKKLSLRWHYWAKAELEVFCNFPDSEGCEIFEITLPGARNPTPMLQVAPRCAQ